MAKLLFQGHGSLRLTSDSGMVIYIDPYAGEGYDLPADVILVTHQHHDHNCIDLPAKKADCKVWQNMDALGDDGYRTLSLPGFTAEAVPAYNHHHRREECVGYVVTVDGVSVYFAGDTGETAEMADLAARGLDYAVLPMDEKYTMDIPETMRCAGKIGAKHTIPVHMAPGSLFDAERAARFTVPGALIVKPGEEIDL